MAKSEQTDFSTVNESDTFRLEPSGMKQPIHPSGRMLAHKISWEDSIWSSRTSVTLPDHTHSSQSVTKLPQVTSSFPVGG